MTGKRATNVILIVHFSNKHIRWEVDLTFKVTGRGRIGADGLAFWYTAAKVCLSLRFFLFHEKTAILSTLQSTESPATGHVYGSVDRWIGLGLFFDSFDNDNKHNNPYIMAMTNDGTKNFDHQVQLEMKS